MWKHWLGTSVRSRYTVSGSGAVRAVGILLGLTSAPWPRRMNHVSSTAPLLAAQRTCGAANRTKYRFLLGEVKTASVHLLSVLTRPLVCGANRVVLPGVRSRPKQQDPPTPELIYSPERVTCLQCVWTQIPSWFSKPS